MIKDSEIEKGAETMRILKSVFISVSIFAILSSGCSRSPSVKFCAKWSDDLTEMWSNSSNVLNYSELGVNKYLIHGGWGATYSGKYFVLLIRGNLPLGQINIKAVRISNGERKPAFILPNMIQNDDPHANLRAIQVYELQLLDPMKQVIISNVGAYTVDSGQYYIFLEKDGVELGGNELIIQ